MAKRKTTVRKIKTGNKKTTVTLELTRVKLLYALSGVFTLCVAGLLIARPTPLAPEASGRLALAALASDPLESAIRIDRDVDPAAWTRIVVERAESLGSASFHFAVLPQASGDQIAISAEWGRQRDLPTAPGELKIALISPETGIDLKKEKTVRVLIERLRERLRITDAEIDWR